MKISTLIFKNAKMKILENYKSEKELASDLASEMNKYIHGASVYDNKIVYDGNKTRKGYPTVITLQIDDESDSKIKIELNIKPDDVDDYPKTLKDTSWAFKKIDNIKDVARNLGGKIKKILMKW